MNTEPDTNTSATTGDGDELDPTEAAAILGQATRQAKLEFDPTPPWKLVAMAFVALLAFGAIWLSVRGDNPYGFERAVPVITYALLPGSSRCPYGNDKAGYGGASQARQYVSGAR